MDEAEEVAQAYAGQAVIALINKAGAQQASKVARQKSLAGHALHFACSALPRSYSVTQVPHRCIISAEGRVLQNLEGLQGLGTLPRTMPQLLLQGQQGTPQLAPSSAAAAASMDTTKRPDAAADEDARLSRAMDQVAVRIREIRDECFSDDLPLAAEMRRWSESALRAYFLSGGTERP